MIYLILKITKLAFISFLLMTLVINNTQVITLKAINYKNTFGHIKLSHKKIHNLVCYIFHMKKYSNKNNYYIPILFSKISNNDFGLRINTAINEKQVRLVDSENGKMIGTFEINDALNQAKALGLDLVEISRGVIPPICKILNFGKFKYKKEKQEKLKALKQRSQSIKEIHLTSGIAENDIKIKCKNAERFLKSGNQVKFIFFLKRREKTNVSIVDPIIKALTLNLNNFGIPQKTTFMGNMLILFYQPKSQNNSKRTNKLVSNYTQSPNTS